MKYLALSIFIMSLIYFSSCSKEENLNPQHVYIKTITSDSDVVVVGCLLLADGNYLIVGRDIKEVGAGTMVKLDVFGKTLWKKRVSMATGTLWKVFEVPGIGFAILGHGNDATNNLNVCTYDNDGNLKNTKLITITINGGTNAPYDVIQLKNGNFVIAGGSTDGLGRLKITDNAFNTLYSRTYSPSPDLVCCYIRGICEMANGDIMMTASTMNQSFTNYTNDFLTMLLITGPTGIKKSLTVLPDSIYNETPNCLVNYNDGMLGISAKMIGVNSGNGTFVSYLNTPNGQYISGIINLSKYDSTGLIIKRLEVAGYPENGQINTIKRCPDGGFILCGTVGQYNSSILLSNTKIYLLKIDANLNQQWSKIINTAYPSFGVDVLQTTDGGYLVSGHQKSFNKHFDMVAIKTDASGNIK